MNSREVNNMKLAKLVLILASGITLLAQPPAPATTFLAIGRTTATSTPAQRAAMLRTEVEDTVRLHVGGTIRQWWLREDRSGIVFIMECPGGLAEAKSKLATLAFVKAKFLEFELVPLVPLQPLELLFTPSSPAGK
jgi:hypothetical protein